MHPRTRLAVDIGPVSTVAALDRHGHQTALVFGDRVTLPTPTMDDGRDVMTALAATRGENAEPVIERMAQHLRAVLSHTGLVGATGLAGAIDVDVVVLTTPPSWGPRQQEKLARAAGLAGLQTAQVISEPAAVATRLFPHAPQDAWVLVCHLGQRTSHATVVQHHQDSWVRVATQPMPTATGDRLDHALAQRLIGHTPPVDGIDGIADDPAVEGVGVVDGAADGVTGGVASRVGQARGHLAAGHPAAIVLPDQRRPISLSAADVQAAAGPLRQMVADCLVDTLDAADVDAHQLHAAVIYGEEADALAPAVGDDQRLGIAVTPAADGRLTAVYGALQAVVGHPVATGAATGIGLPAGWGKYGQWLVAPLMAALTGGVLLWQSFEIVERLMPRGIYRLPSDYEKLSVYFDTAAFAVSDIP